MKYIKYFFTRFARAAGLIDPQAEIGFGAKTVHPDDVVPEGATMSARQAQEAMAGLGVISSEDERLRKIAHGRVTQGLTPLEAARIGAVTGRFGSEGLKTESEAAKQDRLRRVKRVGELRDELKNTN